MCILIFLFLSCQIGKVRTDLGQLSGKSALHCSDASIARYLIARNWDVKKATRMLKKTLKWRSEYKPDEICWVRFFLSHIALKDVTMVHMWFCLCQRSFLACFVKHLVHYGIWFDELLSDRKSYFAFLYVGWHIGWSGDRENLPNWLLWQDWAEYPCHETWMPGLIMLFCPLFSSIFSFLRRECGEFPIKPFYFYHFHCWMHIFICI